MIFSKTSVNSRHPTCQR